MVDWLGLDRTQMLRDVIVAYENEIEVERSRAERLRERLARIEMAQGKLEERGVGRHIHRGIHHGMNLVARQHQHRLEATEHQIKLMDDILVHFREELAQEEAAKARPR